MGRKKERLCFIEGGKSLRGVRRGPRDWTSGEEHEEGCGISVLKGLGAYLFSSCNAFHSPRRAR